MRYNHLCRKCGHTEWHDELKNVCPNCGEPYKDVIDSYEIPDLLNTPPALPPQREYPSPHLSREEKHKNLFEEELKDYNFSPAFKMFLIDFVDYSIQSMALLCALWLKLETDPSLMKGMIMRSCYFFVHGVLLQFLVGFGYYLNTAEIISDQIVLYIVSQALDVFGVKAGIIPVS